MRTSFGAILLLLGGVLVACSGETRSAKDEAIEAIANMRVRVVAPGSLRVQADPPEDVTSDEPSVSEAPDGGSSSESEDESGSGTIFGLTGLGGAAVGGLGRVPIEGGTSSGPSIAGGTSAGPGIGGGAATEPTLPPGGTSSAPLVTGGASGSAGSVAAFADALCGFFGALCQKVSECASGAESSWKFEGFRCGDHAKCRAVLTEAIEEAKRAGDVPSIPSAAVAAIQCMTGRIRSVSCKEGGEVSGLAGTCGLTIEDSSASSTK